MREGKLYLIPTPLSSEKKIEFLPKGSLDILSNISILFVETPKVSRALLSELGLRDRIQEVKMVEVGKRLDHEELDEVLLELSSGVEAALVSDLGMPCIGDPGSLIVGKAHDYGIKVIPMPGPNSFLQALMASGFSGQAFQFWGYLPIERDKKQRSLKEMVYRIKKENSTQIFMETPYRNQTLLDEVLRAADPGLGLCMAIDLNGDQEEIISCRISDWKKLKFKSPKLPAVFVLGQS